MPKEKFPEGGREGLIDVREKVLRQIREKKIKIRSPFVFLAQRLGMESAFISFLIFGALVASIIFYFFDKTGLLKFLSLGFPGFKIFLSALPYDYIALFILSIIVAIYFANKLEIFSGKCEHTERFTVWLFVLAVFLGIFFAVSGAGDFLHDWTKRDIPAHKAVYGKIKNFSPNEIIMEDQQGKVVQIYPDKDAVYLFNVSLKTGKFLRAVGYRDLNNDQIFHAEQIRCCDDD